MEADRIEAVLAKHNVSARVRGGLVAPKFVRFDLSTEMGARVGKITSLAEEIALALNKREARVYRNGGAISVEVPRIRPSSVRLLAVCEQMTTVPPSTAVLGVEADGRPLLLHLPAPDVAHVLVAGTTGSGKTAIIRTLLSSLAYYNDQVAVNLVLIDPKGRGFRPLAQLPHVAREVASTEQQVGECLSWLVGEMERRDRNDLHEPRLIVAIDELADLIAVNGMQVEKPITRLAQRGREAGIHLIACTQRPTAAMIGSAMKANFPVRLVGAVASKEEARYAAGMADSGAEKLQGKGDFLLVTKGQAIRFQAAWIGPKDLATLVDRVSGGERQFELLDVAPAKPLEPKVARPSLWRRLIGQH